MVRRSTTRPVKDTPDASANIPATLSQLVLRILDFPHGFYQNILEPSKTPSNLRKHLRTFENKFAHSKTARLRHPATTIMANQYPALADLLQQKEAGVKFQNRPLLVCIGNAAAHEAPSSSYANSLERNRAPVLMVVQDRHECDNGKSGGN